MRFLQPKPGGKGLKEYKRKKVEFHWKNERPADIESEMAEQVV